VSLFGNKALEQKLQAQPYLYRLRLRSIMHLLRSLFLARLEIDFLVSR
jgi:hypothetical protein